MSGSLGFFLASNIFWFCWESFKLPLFLSNSSETYAVFSLSVVFSVVSKSCFSTSSFLFRKVVTDLVEPLVSKISAILSFLENLSGLEEEELPSKNSSICYFDLISTNFFTIKILFTLLYCYFPAVFIFKK